MSKITSTKNIFTLLLFCSLLAFQTIETAAQCGGTFFKRLASTNTPVNGFITYSVDMTGDGIPDLVGYTGTAVTNGNSGWTSLIILPSNGNGTFGTPITINPPPGMNFQPFIIGDYDNDNFKDIIATVTYPNSKIVYRNNGNGTFTTIPVTTNGFGNFYFMLDINGDGNGDIISDYGGIFPEMRYRLGNGDGSFQPPVPLVESRNIQPGDFNSDGKPDFIAGNNLLLNQGNGVFTTVSTVIVLYNFEALRDVRDYTGDGKPDILAYEQGSDVRILLFKNLGNNNFQRVAFTIAAFPNSGNWQGNVFFGNFGGDASPDVLFRAENQDKTVLYTNDGTGNLTATNYNYKFNANFAGDYDNDGKTDALRVSEGNFNPPARHKLFYELNLTVQKNVCSQPGQTRIADFDRGGATDYSYWTPADGKWAVTGKSPFNWGASVYGDVPAPGDFDGDGITDYAVYRNSTGDWWIYRSSDSQPSAVRFGLPGDKPVVGDYDGDSISDLAVWRPSDGNWYILYMGTQSYTIAHWGADGDKPVPEDYDGDGKTDLAVFRPSTGFWYYLKSSDLNLGAVQFGIASDRPVAADYDGDGKAEIAVYRDSENYLHMLRSSNFNYAAFSYGFPGDLPQPGDFDGDFVFDFGLYRPADQSWYSTNAGTAVTFGASNVIPTASILRIE